jgi:hypothetical protein
MARNLFQVYTDIIDIARKERGAFVTIEQVISYLDNGQQELFDFYIDLYRRTQKIDDGLTPFKMVVTNVTNPLGEISAPADYVHLRSLSNIFGSTQNKVQFVSEDELSDAVNSQLRPISGSNPIGIQEYDQTFKRTKFIIYPNITQYYILRYFRRPVTPVLSYTQVDRTITYDPLTSTQLEWEDVSYINKIIAKALTYMGINLSEDKIIQYGLMKDSEIS